MLQGDLSPAQQAKQAELENKVDALREKMRQAMIRVQAAQAASGDTLSS
jgi:outer membrane murein-binding lipoprotein Lpp